MSVNKEEDMNRPVPQRGLGGGPAVRRILLSAIMGGDREIIICHQNDEYRLRLTSNNKLLLTK